MALVLNEDWTAYVVGQMHKYRITNIELAARCVYKAGDWAQSPIPNPQSPIPNNILYIFR